MLLPLPPQIKPKKDSLGLQKKFDYQARGVVRNYGDLVAQCLDDLKFVRVKFAKMRPLEIKFRREDCWVMG